MDVVETDPGAFYSEYCVLFLLFQEEISIYMCFGSGWEDVGHPSPDSLRKQQIVGYLQEESGSYLISLGFVRLIFF